MAAATTGKKLYECPTNVKEALDWLEALGRNANDCATVIKQQGKEIIKDFNGNVDDVCQKAREFSSAIKKNGGSAQQTYKADGWTTMCQNAAGSGGGKCCGSGGSGCDQCQQSSGKCDGCCAKCPKQICARIFCLIVPVLSRVFTYLLGKCNTKNGKKGEWATQKISNGSTGQEDLKQFMLSCGFEAEKLNETTGFTLAEKQQGALTNLTASLWTIKGAIEKSLQSDSNDPKTNFLKDASPASNKKPSSLTDLLLWLQFLPYCSKYKDVLDAVKKKINGNQGSNGNENIVTHLKESISELPMLFLQIEGKGERQNGTNGSSLFLKISELSKCQYIFDQKYYEDKEKVCKMLLCVFPVIHWGLTALKEKCNDSNCSSTLTACESTKKLLQSLGWNGTEGKPSVSGNMNCKTFRDYLSTNFLGNSSALAEMKKILEGVWKADNAPTGSSASSGSYLPKTIYEMLIWLMGLPVSEKFKDLKTQIKGLNGGSGGSNGVNVTDVMPQFTEILFQVPHLFLALNGDLSGMLNGLFQCHGISEPSKAYQYGSSGSECLKIFSAIVAILFPVIRYLQQRCKNDSVFKNGESWSTKETNADGLKTYLNFAGFQPISSSGMNGQQFHSGVLQPIFGDLTGQNGGAEKLKKLYDCAQKGIQQTSSSTTGSHTPSTIRQMMLWLIGLPVTKEYGNNGSGLIQTVTTKAQQINDLKNKITNGHTSFQHQFQHSIVGMMTVINQIEGGLKSVVEFLKEGFKDGSKFKYDGFNGDESLLKVFSSYVTSVHVQLRFLKVMCGRQKDQGGWKDCLFDSEGGTMVNGIACSCSGGGFLGTSCPTPLRHYLNGNGKNQFQNKDELAPMGFKGIASSSNNKGSHIYDFLKDLIDPIDTQSASQSPTTPTPKPLSLLTQYCVAIGKMDPSSLGDHFDVFRELANGMWSKIQTQVKESVKGITKDDESGQGASGRLQQALQAVWPTGHNKHDGDLASLTGCQGNNCTPFIASLSHGLYQYFDPTKLRSPANKINWLYMKMSGLYGKLKELLGEMKKECKCCPDGRPQSTGCNGITQCPNCLPLMYKMGLVFGDPVTISTNKCSELMEKMKKVLDATSKLCVVFTSIEPGRFKPYLLFGSYVVHGKKDQLTGGDDLKTYTHALGEEYQKYLEGKKGELEQTAQKNKTARDNALKCTCSSHSYSAPAAGSGTATTVTLTLYFHKDGVTTKLELKAPHHGPLSNPLVRLYPRNLKSIVDWLLRIGQTRLGQDGSVASTKDTGLEDMCNTFFPKIQECLNVEDKDVFKALVKGVISLMGLQNQGKTEVEKEVKKEYDKAQKNIQKKLNGGSEGFEKTFTSILTFKPNKYIDKVIEDFGKRVCNVTTNGVPKERSFECIAKSVSTCMKDSLKEIQKLATQNKSEMKDKYGVSIEDLKETIQEVSELTSIDKLKQLCDGFKSFHTAYTTVTGAFTDHLTTAQSSTGQEHWQKITKCVEAFEKLGECATELEALNGMSSADNMTQASTQLEQLSKKLQDVYDKLKEDDIKTFSAQVDDFIKKLDDELKTNGVTALATALQINNGGSKTFDQLLKSYVSNVIQEMKNNTNNTSCDLHLRVRNDLQQLSECLKVMCEVCSTGIKEFAAQLKECVTEAKGHLEKIVGIQLTLKNLNGHLHVLVHPYSTETIGMNKLYEAREWSIRCVRSLFMSEYIYNPPIIVSTFITQDDVNKMTKYLKSLPDLIRDRYVLQKWHDSPAHFCGVQSFNNGIVKKTDMDGITGVLQDLLKEAFHSDAASDITIHDFQVRAVIYNFCHKEAMEKIGSGVRLLYFVSHYVNKDQGTNTSSSELKWEKIKGNNELKRVVDDICGNSYLRYFASHLRDSVGYHALSNTLGALDKVKEKLGENNGEPEKWSDFKGLLKKDAIDDLSKRLEALLAQLYKEYIFEYPPFDWQKSCQRLVEQNKGSRARRAAAAPSSSPTPSNTCSMCVPSMAQIFIGFVPQMYRLFKMLREMTKVNGYGHQHKLEFNNNGTDAKTTTMSSLAGILLREGWRLKLGNETSGDDHPYDLNHEKTGSDVCTLLEAIIGDKEPGVLLAQRENNVSTTDLQPLDKLFKAVMQHFKEKRDEKIKKRIQELKTRFEADPNNKGIPFLAPPPVLPSTVRQVLFWLHEMDTKGEFYNAMSQHINTLCERSNIKSGISQDTILHVLKLSITQCLEVLATIEDPGRQNAQYYYELYTEEHYYAYQTVNIPLFFYTFVEKLMGAFLELNFVCVQCEFTGKQGGWKDCHIGEVYNKAYDISGGTSCICHERKLAGPPMLRVEVEGSLVCPKPLSAFLFSDQKNQLKVPMDPTLRLPYMSKGTMPCGFKLKNKAITDAATRSAAQSAPTPTPAPTSVSGSVLVEPLRKLVGGHVTGRHTNTSTRKDENNTLSTVIYLRDLLRYTLCLAVRPPWSMSENMAFFYRVTESWKKNNNVVGGVPVALRNDNLLGAIHAEIDMFPGTFRASLLTSAVERFAGVEDEHQNGAHSNTSHHYDLRTLMGCQEKTTTGTSATGTTAKCSPFIFPLSLDVYTHYDHKNSRAYLSWILNFAFGIYGQLKALEEMMQGSACVRNASQSNSQCPSLPTCPGVLTAVYQSGSSFMDQGQLRDVNTSAAGTNTTRKTCNDFHSVLSGLFNCDSDYCTPLHNLIVQCEAFLWSIRMPFSLVQLSLWSVAILFISYVFVVPLDHFKIKSHLFNRLKYTMHPSLLIADQQRRVSEVAYFSLHGWRQRSDTLRLPYMSKGTMPCGFKLKNKAITDAASSTPTPAPTPTPTPAPTSMTGSVLVEPLRKLVGGHVTGRHSGTTTNGLNTLSTVIYLRDLLRYVLCLAVRPPWSMSEYMAFFYRMAESWKQKGHVAQHNANLRGAIHAEIALFPGRFKAELLTKAVERFAGIEDNKQHGTSVPAHSNASHHHDLKTLMGCQEKTTTGTSATGTTAKCSTFMFPLSLDVYTHYDQKNSRAYLSWILNFAFGIYGQLRGLEEMIKKQKCVRNASQSKSQCPSLPMCPGVLTALYQSGSSFMDQKILADKKDTNTSSTNTTKKTCNDFHSVLSGLFNCHFNTSQKYCSPLHNLIVQCEAFLWSIRLPFSLVQLSLWSFAVLFISYVFVVPLDHFKIKSHLFNRLKYTMHPSLLIADQQRRVSEVAYFSL